MTGRIGSGRERQFPPAWLPSSFDPPAGASWHARLSSKLERTRITDSEWRNKHLHTTLIEAAKTEVERLNQGQRTIGTTSPTYCVAQKMKNVPKILVQGTFLIGNHETKALLAGLDGLVPVGYDVSPAAV